MERDDRRDGIERDGKRGIRAPRILVDVIEAIAQIAARATARPPGR